MNTNRNTEAHKTPLRSARKVGEFMTADFSVVNEFRESVAADSRKCRASITKDHSTGRAMWICALFMGCFLSIGCAAKPVAPPASPYEACYQQAKVDATSALATSVVVTADATDKVLSALIAAEEYLQGKVEEFRKDHPKLVAKGEEKLAAIRQQISEYKERLSKKLSLSTH